MVSWLLLAFGFQVNEIPLPQGVMAVTDLVRTERGFAILDAVGGAVFHFTPDGQLLATHNRKGNGPGEFQKPFRLRYHENHFYLVDLMRRTVLEFDDGLNYLRDWKIWGMPRDIWVDREGIFLVYWDPRTQHMVHKMSPSGQWIVSFGTGLDQEGLLGFQSGQILKCDRLLYFVHHFIPVLEVFETSGAMVRQLPFPGFGLDETFVDLNRLLGQEKPFNLVIQDLFPALGFLVVKLRDYETQVAWTYVFDISRQEFVKKVDCPWNAVSDQKGHFFQIIMDQEGDPIRLKSLDM